VEQLSVSPTAKEAARGLVTEDPIIRRSRSVILRLSMR